MSELHREFKIKSFNEYFSEIDFTRKFPPKWDFMIKMCQIK